MLGGFQMAAIKKATSNLLMARWFVEFILIHKCTFFKEAEAEDVSCAPNDIC